MADENARVVIEMFTASRIRLAEQLRRQMERNGFTGNDYKSLDLGFDLPEGWPAAEGLEVTLAQLTVLAHRLDMRIVINGIDIYKMRYSKGKNNE